MKNDLSRGIERRRNGRFWVVFLRFFNWLSVILILVILILTERARPQFESFFDRFYGLKLRVDWDMEFVSYVVWCSVAGSVFSLLGLIMSLARARRKTDPKRIPLILIGIVSLVGLVAVKLAFG